jgi:hypothetical protein
MNEEAIKIIIEAALLVVTFLIGRYVVPHLPTTKIKETITKIEGVAGFISTWAERFVIVNARKNIAGSKKMDNVIESVTNIAQKYGISVTEDEIRAIAQQCYENLIGSYDFMYSDNIADKDEETTTESEDKAE